MKQKMILYLLVICVLCSMIAVPTHAVELSTKENVNTIVEEIAKGYIERYISKTYLYETCDLKENTISALTDVPYAADASSAALNVDGVAVPITDLTETLTSFEAISDYYYHIRTEQAIARYDFSCTVDVLNTSISGNSARVALYSYMKYKYEPSDGYTEEGEHYTVWLSKLNGSWYISKIDFETMQQFASEDVPEYCSRMIREFDQQRAEPAVQSETVQAAEATRAFQYYDRTYNQNNACAYAYTYTTSTYTASANDSSFMNGLFSNCTNLGGNCQNFVSQCIWAGFGGSNDADSINNRLSPMDTVGSSELYQWYTAIDPWVCTDCFRRYLANSAGASETNGMTSSYTSDAACEYTSSFTGQNDASLLGAAVYVNKNSNGYGHVVLITDAAGLEFENVQYCGNSPMRKDKKLSDSYSGTVCLVKPYLIREGRTCSNGSHVFSVSNGTKTSYCRYCGFVKLRVTPTMLRPVPVGSTQTLYASASGAANTTCYRMAIRVTTPSGETIWSTYTNTSSISHRYTFASRGLYTIEVVARDLDPDTSLSRTANQVYTIRVY